MKSILNLIFLLFFLLPQSIHAQTGIQLNGEDALNGYTLVQRSSRVVLLDNCGKIVHEWDISGSQVLFHCKLLPNGNLLYIDSGFIVERNWENEIVNTAFAPLSNLKYEVILLPNQNYLAVGRRNVSSAFFTNLGMDLTNQLPFFVDIVVEIDRDTEEIVWKWDISDHVIQERDELAGNYGVVSENPQLLNLDAISLYDWTTEESFMINGMDYNPELDQIALSVRKMNEVIIIDHSTTTEEASGSTGGNQGKGGDILYRWGNPQNYGQGTEEDRQLYYQHNPNWIKYGEHTGSLILFNNGLGRPVEFFSDLYSSAEIITPPLNTDGAYILEQNTAFEPATADITYDEFLNPELEFYSGYVSGAKVLPNGNIFVTSGMEDQLMELNPAGELVWHYTLPSSTGAFRAVKYAANYSAFDGKELLPQGTLEVTPSDYDCNYISNTNDIKSELSDLDFNHALGSKIVTLENKGTAIYDIRLLSMQGVELKTEKLSEGYLEIPLKSFSSGIYFISIQKIASGASAVYKIVIP